MLEPGDKILVGFSGGPDSMALLHTLKSLHINICAMHLNHQLRGKQADQDEKFAVMTAKKYRVPIKTRKIDVKQYGKKYKMSIEEGARTLRYQKLINTAKMLHCQKIALGHNINDNTETVILNLTRGSGLTGLSGIPPTRDNIIRPLIETSRAEILAYLKQNKIKYCHDLSNIELGFRRNYIRHKIIPLLLEINPNLDQTILRTSEIIRTTNNDIGKMVEQAKKEVLLKSNPGRINIDIKKLLSYNLLIRREIIKAVLPRLEFNKVETILALTNKPSGKKIAITTDCFVEREYNKLIISHPEASKISDKVWNVNINKPTKIPMLGLELMVKSRTRKNAVLRIAPVLRGVVFDKSAIDLPLSIRLRKPGDRFVPFKGKEKKLKDILIDDKIPVRERDRLPLLCDQDNILWIIGSRRSNFGLITKETKEIIEVKVKKKYGSHPC